MERYILPAKPVVKEEREGWMKVGSIGMKYLNGEIRKLPIQTMWIGPQVSRNILAIMCPFCETEQSSVYFKFNEPAFFQHQLKNVHQTPPLFRNHEIIKRKVLGNMALKYIKKGKRIISC
ncbi:MAG: hypothetical protein ACTSUE_10635, partial [Promethearchaeota archaeon]